MPDIAIIDPREITITPVFKMIELENIPKSEKAGHAVMELKEVVEVRFAGTKHYAPVFPADAMWKREGNQVWTYAERWPEQYRAFKEGNPQEAMGTPLEMLRPFGVTPEQLSLCRALRIYSIEALNAVEGPALKSLGMHGNPLKDAVRRYIADHTGSSAAFDEIAALKAELAKFRGEVSTRLEREPTPTEVEQAIQAADDAYTDMSDDDLRDEIAKVGKTARPADDVDRPALTSMLNTLLEAA